MVELPGFEVNGKPDGDEKNPKLCQGEGYQHRHDVKLVCGKDFAVDSNSLSFQ